MEENEMNKIEQIRECFLAKARQYLLTGNPEKSPGRNSPAQHYNTCAFTPGSDNTPPQP